MKWIEILRKDDLALLQSETDTQYVVAVGYDPDAPENEQWMHGDYFVYAGSNKNKKEICLASAVDTFLMKTEENYISRCRLEELAIFLKDRLIEDDRESALEYFDEVCEMSDKEKEWFGINHFTNGFENSPKKMAEKLMEFNRDFSDSEEEIEEETVYVAELFDKLQKSEEFEILARHLDVMFTDSTFK